ncbi:MAG: hypothetical protein LBK27_01625 [Treponema sp.]|nr:hypothetical protein [Treponema sp.]
MNGAEGPKVPYKRSFAAALLKKAIPWKAEAVSFRPRKAAQEFARSANSARPKPRTGMDAGCNSFISFLHSKKLTAQKRHGGRF